jgi:ketosteroid isomerase-like protein
MTDWALVGNTFDAVERGDVAAVRRALDTPDFDINVRVSANPFLTPFFTNHTTYSFFALSFPLPSCASSLFALRYGPPRID